MGGSTAKGNKSDSPQKEKKPYERKVVALGNKALVQDYQVLEELNKGVFVKGGEANARRRDVEPLGVHVRAEKANVVRCIQVRLHPLEALQSLSDGWWVCFICC